MVMRVESIEREIESRVEALGYEFVELEWAGRDDSPILRLRVDRPGSTRGQGVTLEDCARVSRGLEAWLDEDPRIPERYTIEVSSPGVERPLHRRRDFRRFMGETLRLRIARGVEGVPNTRFEAVLKGLEEGESEDQDTLILEPTGAESAHGPVRLLRSGLQKAQLVFDWSQVDLDAAEPGEEEAS
jgi:ribosome maturation factor RimP